MKKPLSNRQFQFVEEYAVSRNGSRAAIRAGYSERSAKVTATRLLTKANIRAALAVREAETAQVLNVTRELVLAEVQNAIRVATMNGDAMAMIAGWREVAKLCGFYAANQHAVSPHAGSDITVENVRAMSDAELAAFDGGRTFIGTASNCN